MSPTKTTGLTDEQKRLLPVMRDRWIAIGLSTVPGDPDIAEQAIRDAYAVAGLPAPQAFVHLPSPLHGVFAAALLSRRSRQAVGREVWQEVWREVWREVGEVGYGLHDAAWLSFYDFFRTACHFQSCQRLEPLIRLAEHASWWWPFQHACIVTAKPTALHRDLQGRLHAESGPALDYAGTWGIWTWHGVRVPRQVIESPETLTVAQVLGEANAEVRRVMLQRMGTEKFLHGIGAEAVHKDDWGILWRSSAGVLDTAGQPYQFVQVVNSTPEQDGSFKDYFLRVSPRLTTAHEAVASTYRLTAEQYHPQIQT